VAAVALPEFQPTEIHRDNRVWYDARDIHEYVQSKQQFANWIQKRIAEIGAVEGVDYVINKFINNPLGGRPTLEYYVTPIMGQELGMLERNARGRVIRLWFIARNQKLESMEANPVTQLADILDNPALNNQLMLELSHRVQKLKQENQIQAQDIEVKSETIKVQAETIQDLAPKAAAADRLMSAGGSMFRFTESGTEVG
jgi:phage anti-repressor protein